MSVFQSNPMLLQRTTNKKDIFSQRIKILKKGGVTIYYFSLTTSLHHYYLTQIPLARSSVLSIRHPKIFTCVSYDL
jgi:hypothetical protein